MPKRPLELDDVYGDTPGRKANKRPANKVKKPKPALFKAVVVEIADAVGVRVSGRTDNIDQNIMAKMKKCLERANNPAATEAEAKAALHLASRLMNRFNVTQADVLAHEPPEVQRKYAGSSIVSIVREDGNAERGVYLQVFVNDLATAMNTFFDCKSYTSKVYRPKSKNVQQIKVVFYGIAENTETAARGFELSYNFACTWARSYKGMKQQNSYCTGFGMGLQRKARKTKQDEEKQAKQAEKAEREARIRKERLNREAELARLAPLPTAISASVVDEPECSAPSPYGSVTTDTTDTDSMSDDDDDFLRAHGSVSDDEDDISAGVSGFDDAIVIDSDSDSDSEGEEEDGAHHGETDFDIKQEEDDEDDDIASARDVDEQIDNLINIFDSPAPEGPSTDDGHGDNSSSNDIASSHPRQDTRTDSVDPEGHDEGGSWKSHMQLVTFQKMATQMADDYIKEKDLKLSKGKKGLDLDKMDENDRKAYIAGKKDSETINVHQKGRITAGDAEESTHPVVN